MKSKNRLIDYESIEKLAIENKPKLIIAGGSAYSRIIDFKKFREICDKVGAYLCRHGSFFPTSGWGCLSKSY